MDEFLLVLAGGLVGVVTAIITNRSADNRLKIQLAHESEQREKDHAAAVRREPIQRLSELNSVITEMFWPLRTPGSRIDTATATRMTAVIAQARIAMKAIGEEEVENEDDELFNILGESVTKEKKAIPEIQEKLASIERHRIRLAESAALA